MQVAVPYYQQTTRMNCGATALRMVLAFLGRTFSLEDVEELLAVGSDQAVASLKLAILAKKLGFRVDFYSAQMEFEEQLTELEFYKRYGAMTVAVNKQLLKEAHEVGVYLYEKHVRLDTILSFVTKSSLPIVLVDWNVVNGKAGYQGHFVPVVGYEDDCVIVHNSDKPYQPFLRIKNVLFDKARMATGTDEDVVVISRV